MVSREQSNSFNNSLQSNSNSTNNVYTPYRKGTYTTNSSTSLHKQPPRRPTIITTRAVSPPDDLAKSRILPSIRNITIFGTLGSGFVVACIVLTLIRHTSFWVTLAAGICGVLGAVLWIEVALLISARYKFKLVDEECQVADMEDEKGVRRGKGLSWDLRGIGKKDSVTEKSSCGDCSMNAATNHSSKCVPDSMTCITEESEKKPLSPVDNVQKPKEAHKPISHERTQAGHP